MQRERKTRAEDREEVKNKEKQAEKLRVKARRADEEMSQERVLRDQRTESSFDS